MKTVIFFVLVGVSTITAETKKTKRGVLGEYNHGEERSNLPYDHRSFPSPQYGPPGDNGDPGYVRSGTGFGLTQNSYNSALNGPQVGPEYPLGKVVNLGREIRNHVDIVNKVGVYVGRPIGVHVERKIPVKVPHPVDVPYPVNVPIHVPVKVPVKVFKDIHVPVFEKVPIPIEVGHVKVPHHVPIKIYHKHAVPVHIVKKVPVPVPDPIIVKKINVPVVAKTILKPLPHGWNSGWW